MMIIQCLLGLRDCPFSRVYRYWSDFLLFLSTCACQCD